MKTITERQFETLKIIDDGQKKGLSPSFCDLRGSLGVSSNQTVQDLLDALSKKWCIDRSPRRARAIMITSKGRMEINSKGNSFLGEQLNLDLGFGTTNNNAEFLWPSSNNVIINQGKANDLPKVISDSSSMISLAEQTNIRIDFSNRIQFVLEMNNFNSIYDYTQEYIVSNYSPLIIILPGVANFLTNGTNGYVILDGHDTYDLFWSGISTGHRFYRGREYGKQSGISFSDSGTGQLKLFSIPYNLEIIKMFNSKIKRVSQWVDFPIYGGALKKDGEIIFWSSGTARDINDLRYLFLVDITKTSFQSDDHVLCRDINHNIPGVILNNSTN